MRRGRAAPATVALLSLAVLATAPGAAAAPAEVSVRIEGRDRTLFEGPVLTEGHDVRGATDTNAPPGGRRCDGLNNHKNPSPGPTPTAASVDAMSIAGQDFDGQWYTEPYEDYFVTRWGPDRQDPVDDAYWGVVVNNVFTSVGGCQYQLDAGDEVLWAYDAFKSKPLLALFPACYSGGVRQLTATAELGQPFLVEVAEYEDEGEDAPPAHPGRDGAVPFEGAIVAPVSTSSEGYETVEASSPEAVGTAADGSASITFSTPGWHRIKATAVGGGGETAIRSNRIDVCVPEPPASGCGELPPDDLVRQALPTGPEPPGGLPPAPLVPARVEPQPPAEVPPLDLGRAQLGQTHLAQGRVGVTWRVLDPGPGVARWTVASRTLGRRGSRYITRARGSSGSTATLKLPLGAAYRLRLTITDILGRSVSASIGTVRVPGPG